MSSTHMPTVKTLMTAFPYHIDSQAPLRDAEQLMQDKHIHHLVVTREDGSFSLLSERDLHRHHALYGMENSDDLIVNDICTEEAVCADINDPADRILDVMAEQHLGSVVILREAELAGIFTTTDACHHFAEYLREHHTTPPDMIA